MHKFIFAIFTINVNMYIKTRSFFHYRLSSLYSSLLGGLAPCLKFAHVHTPPTLAFLCPLVECHKSTDTPCVIPYCMWHPVALRCVHEELLWLRSFSKSDKSRSVRVKRSTFSIKSDLLQCIWEKSDLATPICAAGHPHCLFTVKKERGLRRSAQTRTRWPQPERSARSFSLDWINLVWQI